MPEKLYISQITLPDGNTYELKDLEARQLIDDLAAGSLAFYKVTGAADTPAGVQWDDDGTTITGTLQPSAETKGKIYLVPDTNGAGKDIYAEYVTVIVGGAGTEQSPYVYAWEKLGDTEIDFSDLGSLAYKNSASGSVSFTTADSASFSNGAVSTSATYTPTGSISVTLSQTSTAATITATDYAPEGTISKPSITVTPTTATVEVKDEGGSVSAGSAASFSSGSFNGGTFTQGTDQYTAPTLTTSVVNEVLTIAFSTGSFTQGQDSFTAATHGADTFQANTPTSVTLPTFKQQTVMTAASAELATTPTFTGTTVSNMIVTAVNYDKAAVSSQTFEGTEATISASGTATGDVSLTKTSKTETVTVA